MRKRKTVPDVRHGEITVFISLWMSVILFFFQAAWESAEWSLKKSRMQEALELAECSVLSEYHRELFEKYGLFYLDLSYGGGAEDVNYLNRRVQSFLDVNLKPDRIKNTQVRGFSRATDGNGEAFYEQAVSFAKQSMGASVLQKIRGYKDYGRRASERAREYEEADARESQNMEELRQRREEEEQQGTPDPVSHTNSLKQGSILHLVLRDPGLVSNKTVSLSAAPSVRTLLSGTGSRGKNPPGAVNDLFFQAYLMEHFPDAQEFLSEERQSGEWLDYQMEYIIAGRDSDIGNLEAVCGRLLLIREGMNYAYLLADSAKVAECAALAAALVGATMIPALVEAMKHVLLLAWAFAESVLDVRMLLNGKRTAFYKDSSTWKLSLSGALELGSLSGFDDAEDARGLFYEDYLGILLTASGRTQKKLRAMDAVEGVIREMTGGRWFYLDQCTDAFWLSADLDGTRELSAERWIAYEW